MESVLETTKYVVENSLNVKINGNKVKEFAANFDHKSVQHWLSAAPFDFGSLNNDQKLAFLLVFNSISFSYWGEPKWTVQHAGQKFDGAWGMITALSRALEKKKPILDAGFRASASKEDFLDLLKANVPIPLIEERYKIFKETGQVLLEKFDGDFSALVRQANGSSLNLLKLIVKTFPSFKDVSRYRGKDVFFLKRAQLLVSDIFQMFKQDEFGSFNDSFSITACADYKLPQALRNFGILEYDRVLADKVDHRVPLEHNGEEEVEIRANTIWSVEYIRERVSLRLPGISPMDINDFLWLYTQIKRADDKPYHLTRTIAY